MSNSAFSLVLVYENGSGEPVSLARSSDLVLISDVALSAVREAQARADAFSDDAVLGKLERAEVRRLRSVLCSILPGFAGPRERRA